MYYFEFRGNKSTNVIIFLFILTWIVFEESSWKIIICFTPSVSLLELGSGCLTSSL